MTNDELRELVIWHKTMAVEYKYLACFGSPFAKELANEKAERHQSTARLIETLLNAKERANANQDQAVLQGPETGE